MPKIASNYLSATETQELLWSGKVSEAQILEDHIRRYTERDGEVGAWVHVNHTPGVMGPEKDRGKGLHGMVLGVKDIMSESVLPVTSSSAVSRLIGLNRIVVLRLNPDGVELMD